MKKTYILKDSGLKSRPEQVSTSRLPKLDSALRQKNRKLNTSQVVQLLETEAPQFHKLIQIVGQWIWIRFHSKQPREITSALSQFGFHWNKRRQTWQHPCGVFCGHRAEYDPRNRYGVQFLARA